MTRELEMTKTGWPCLWEKGGAKETVGNATIICDYDGKPKYPVVIKIKGNLASSIVLHNIEFERFDEYV